MIAIETASTVEMNRLDIGVLLKAVGAWVGAPHVAPCLP
ncbi:hypothetical protein C357_16883 [Citreicella sp. 357]|nr:hypothetical protein C357_16883 [Citreicella sp. 357]